MSQSLFLFALQQFSSPMPIVIDIIYNYMLMSIALIDFSILVSDHYSLESTIKSYISQCYISSYDYHWFYSRHCQLFNCYGNCGHFFIGFLSSFFIRVCFHRSIIEQKINTKTSIKISLPKEYNIEYVVTQYQRNKKRIMHQRKKGSRNFLIFLLSDPTLNETIWMDNIYRRIKR